MTGALEGLKILDFTQMMTGPMGTMILGDFGADVIKVEQPAGDPFRKSGETSLGGDSVFFLSVNRNKRGIALDLKSEAGRKAARELADQADVFVENFRPGFSEAAGLGYEELRKTNPGLIYCSITGFGQTGPDANRPALDQVIQAMSGMMQITGTPETGPLKTGFPFADLVTALISTIGILAALEARHRTGLGQRIDLAMLDATIFSMVPRDVFYSVTKSSPPLTGNQHWDIVPNDTYKTADGREIMIITINDKFWRILVEAMGAPALAADPRYATKQARLANRGAVDAELRALFASKTMAEWDRLLGAAGAIYGPVKTWPEVFEAPATRDALIRTVSHPTAGDYDVVQNPVQLSQTPHSIRRPPPTFGQHNAEILREGAAVWAVSDQ
jgi:formyl-CoA transferase